MSYKSPLPNRLTKKYQRDQSEYEYQNSLLERSSADKEQVMQANLHLRLEAIRLKEKREYQQKVQHELSKQRSEQLGLPQSVGKHSLFSKQYMKKPTSRPQEEQNYVEAMKTNDAFKHVEEYDHILANRQQTQELSQEPQLGISPNSQNVRVINEIIHE